MATKKERATQIRTATKPGENTAERVGALLEEFADHQDRVDTALETFNEELAETNITIGENKAEAGAKISYTPAMRTITLANSENVVKSIANLPHATTSVPGLMAAADKKKLDGIPGAFVLDLGQVSSADVGDAQAAKSEIAGNRNIFAIRYTTQGVSALKTTVIIQWCNGIDVSAQIKFTDKSQWRRNVTGATGVAGAPTNAFEWERTGAHYMGYDAATRKLQLKDYEQHIIKEVQLPLATPSAAGLMSAEDKSAVNKIGGIENNVTTLQSEVETLKGNFVHWNYSGGFNVGDTIPVSEFMSHRELRMSLLKPAMYVYYGPASGRRINKLVIWRDYNEDGTTTTFSFAFFDGEAVVKHVLTLNEAGDTWTVTE